jgi:Protein O-mannosyl-transferase TMEM260-like
VRRGLPALAALFLFAHLAALPPTLDDIDAINFALGVRDFDVAQHQPHPPGYPVFIALGKLATPLLRAAGVAAPEVRGLALWSAIGGAALVLLVFGLWRTLDVHPWRPALAATIAAASPLFWFTSLRPLSDVLGLSVAIAALSVVVRALPAGWSALRDPSPRALLVGGFLAGLAIGIRSQTVVLTAPLLATLLLLPGSAVPVRIRIGSMAAAALGVAVWAVPLVVVSGGLAGYLNALGSQAGEDFSGVVMLWTNRSPRVAALALLNTFVLPWDSAILAGVVLALAGVGALLFAAGAREHVDKLASWLPPSESARLSRVASAFRRKIARSTRLPPKGGSHEQVSVTGSPDGRWTGRRQLLVLAIMFGPYAVFHLVFQETVTVRYALPLVLPIAYLVSIPLSESRPMAAAAAGSGLVVWMLVLAVPAGFGYGRSPSPIFRLLGDMNASPDPAPVVGMHRRAWTESRRARRWNGEPPGQLLPAPRDYEWLELTRTWRARDVSSAWFVADPRRTDLALIDPASRHVVSYRWPLRESSYVGGARPDEVDLVTIAKPGWFLEQGWALTPEVAGITGRDGGGPNKRPSIGWIRSRPGESVMMIGGRHLGGAADAPVRIHIALDDRPILTFAVQPGFFLRFEPLAAGALAAAGPFLKLTVTADSASGGAVSPVSIEQFDLQPPDVTEMGFDEGWQEPEYNPQTGRSWRWMSERAVVLVRGPTRDLMLKIAGESTRPYFRRASRVTVTVDGQTVSVIEASRDFNADVAVPGALLAKAGGRIVLTSDQMFIPGDREGTADRRHLAVRLYSVTTSQQ